MMHRLSVLLHSVVMQLPQIYKSFSVLVQPTKNVLCTFVCIVKYSNALIKSMLHSDKNSTQIATSTDSSPTFDLILGYNFKYDFT